MSDMVERVAEALWRADENADEMGWWEVTELWRDHYGRLAQAAIDALGLTEERRPRGLYRCDDPALKHTEHRLVSPWVQVEERAE